ncbi:MAG: InlB B-repeat-containing protein [Spirochaetota bacterium]
MAATSRTCFALAALALALFATGCTAAVTPENDTRTTAQKALDTLGLADIQFPGGGSSAAVTGPFILPLASSDGLWSLSWSTTCEYVTKIDATSGQVFLNLPDVIPAGTQATLSVTASPKGSRDTAVATATGATKDFSLTLSVPASDTQIADAVASALSGKLLDFSGKDSVSSVSGNFTLPLQGNFGTDITWTVTGDGVAFDAATGKVSVATPTTATPAQATLTPTVKKKKGSAAAVEPAKQPDPIIITIPPLTPAQAVEGDVIALPEMVASVISALPGASSDNTVVTDFALPVKGDRDTTLTWTSSDPSVCTVAQTVTSCTVDIIPPTTGTTEVTLTAVVAKPSEPTPPPTVSVSVKVKVKAPPVYTVTFDSQSATTAADPATKTVTSPATTVAALPTAPTKTGFTFGGWYTAADGGGSQFLATTTVSAGLTVFAKWNAGFAVSYLDAIDKSLLATQYVTPPATTVGTLPTITKAGFYLSGSWLVYPPDWMDSTKDAFLGTTVVSADTTVYVLLLASPVVTFSVNGTTLTTTTVPASLTLGALPTEPTPASGALFGGWNSKADGSGTEITAASTIRQSQTAYAIFLTPTQDWRNVACSDDGKYLVACAFQGSVYVSSDYGVHWSKHLDKSWWGRVVISRDGKTMGAISTTIYDSIWLSTDYGATWASKAMPNSTGPAGIAISPTGDYVAVSDTTSNVPYMGGRAYISDDGCATWKVIPDTIESEALKGRAGALLSFAYSDSTSTKVGIAVQYNSQFVFYPTVAGALATHDASTVTFSYIANLQKPGISTFVIQDTGTSQYSFGVNPNTGTIFAENWIAATGSNLNGAALATQPTTTLTSAKGVSALGSGRTAASLVACVNGGEIYTSSNRGGSWTVRTTALAQVWTAVACSGDFSRLVAVSAGATTGSIYLSSNSGVTWTKLAGF